MDLRKKLMWRRDLRDQELAAKHEWERVKDEREKLDAQVFEHMEYNRIEGMKVDGTNFVPTTTIYAQVQDSDSFVAWAEEHDPTLLEPKPRKDPLNELVREKLDNGESLPPGLGFNPKQVISQRAA